MSSQPQRKLSLEMKTRKIYHTFFKFLKLYLKKSEAWSACCTCQHDKKTVDNPSFLFA